MTSTAAQFRTILTEANSRFIQREEMIEVLGVAIAAKLNSLAISPPGCAKTAVGEFVIGSIHGATTFDVSLSMSMSDQFIVGPIDIARYRETGFMARQGLGYIQTSDYARIEEIGRAQDSVMAYLLPLLNPGSRKFHEAIEGGRTTVTPPLRSVYATSNSFLVEEDGTSNAAALNDRFSLKVTAGRINDQESFERLLSIPDIEGATNLIRHADLSHAQDVDIPAIPIPAEVRPTLFTLKRTLAGENITPSDRQWRQIQRAAQAVAWLRGGTTVGIRDFRIARHMVWEFEGQITKASDVVNDVCGGEPPVVVEARKLRHEISAEMAGKEAESATWGARAVGRLFGQMEKLRKAQGSAADEEKTIVAGELRLVEMLRARLVSEVMGVDDLSLPSLG